MRLYNLTMKVNRLEMLKAQIGLELVSSFDEMQKFFEQKLTDRTLEEFERQAGILGESVGDVTLAASSIVGASFHNATFSQRIWANQDLLRSEISKLLQTGMIQGRHPDVLARELRKQIDVSRFNSERLMRTEMARVQTEAQMQLFERYGFDEYEYLACHYGDVCAACKELDGKHYKTKDAMPGENAPPMHPFCHCSTCAWLDEEKYNQWLDSYGDHGLSFKEWQETRRKKGKSVELPRELIKTKQVPEDVKNMISETIDKISTEYHVNIDDIEYAPFHNNPKAPFTFIPYDRDGKYAAKLNINSLFDWNESVEAFDDRIYNKNYRSGILASKTSRDLLYHEAAHFITFQDCETFQDYVAKESEVRKKYIEGVSGYADATEDGAETIAEAFVRKRNGEDLADNVSKLLDEYM